MYLFGINWLVVACMKWNGCQRILAISEVATYKSAWVYGRFLNVSIYHDQTLTIDGTWSNIEAAFKKQSFVSAQDLYSRTSPSWLGQIFSS